MNASLPAPPEPSMSALLPTLSPTSLLPIELVRGAGAQLFDSADKAYWDFYGGHAVALLGQGHPAWVAAITEQAQTLSFVTTVAPLTVRDDAARALADFGRMDRVFFVNSGAEANEAALKVARKATGREVIVAMESGFHGRTMACLGVTQSGRYRSQHSPVHGTVRFVPYGDLDALAAALDDTVAGVLIEPMQGIAGVIEPPAGFLAGARTLCDEHGATLIFDEVQTGVGRTGLPFAWHAEPTSQPDLVTCGKSLGAGFPVAALLLTEAMSATTSPGEHGTTFGAAPLACAAVSAVLQTVARDDLLAGALRIGEAIASFAPGGAHAIPGVSAVRGRGCLLGVVLDRPAKPVVAALREHGIIAGTANDPHCLRLAPPAILPAEALTDLHAALRACLD
ncbi:MAG: aspartate aminotransferase family protein [Deltaproteobacteria bacterium]|nr:aspartate aminotransferase family protein [Deltaproteobacteria bacterium]